MNNLQEVTAMSLGIRAEEPPPTTPAIAVGPQEAARLLEVSSRELRRLRARGLFPDPDMAFSSRSPRWSVDGLRAWLNAGCPPAERWRVTRPKGGAR